MPTSVLPTVLHCAVASVRWQKSTCPRRGVRSRGATTARRVGRGHRARLVQRAAMAHSVYSVEPRQPMEVKAGEEHLARWLTRRIDMPVKLFDLKVQGFELVGGRLLPDGPGKSAQFMQPVAQGLRVTVYLRKPEQGATCCLPLRAPGRTEALVLGGRGLRLRTGGCVPARDAAGPGRIHLSAAPGTGTGRAARWLRHATIGADVAAETRCRC